MTTGVLVEVRVRGEEGHERKTRGRKDSTQTPKRARKKCEGTRDEMVITREKK